MEMEPAVVIFTKVPGVGRVKTRLSSAITGRQAGELQRRFLQDILLMAEGGRWSLVLSYAPEEGWGQLEALVDPQVLRVPQRGGSLGSRMLSAFRRAFGEGFAPVVMIGSDTPTLPADYLSAALKALEGCDVVLGPSVDGGYYLVGMHRIHEGLFRGVEWSTPRVLEQTVRRIKRGGLSLACLPVWYDVDTVEDLRFLKAHLELLRSCGRAFPGNTYRLLKEMRI